MPDRRETSDHVVGARKLHSNVTHRGSFSRDRLPPLTLTGFPPGKAAAFRVVARKGSRIAGASNVAVIYPSSEDAELKVAA